MDSFDPDCRRCTRLDLFLQEVKRKQPQYFCKPVPSFGDSAARLLIVGLAPGMHGANATGRPFTGDHAGILLYQTLYATGFASQPTGATADDGLRLTNCRITNAVRCLPPANKPEGVEVQNCNGYLGSELAQLPRPAVVLSLGVVAHGAVLRALKLRPKDYAFGHGSDYLLDDGLRLLSSYHCSRYNTQTRRLTADMFQAVFAQARQYLAADGGRNERRARI